MAMKRLAKRILLHALGRPIRCEYCGALLFRGVPLVRRGGVRLIGAERALVRVDFDSMNRLVFAHLEVDRCQPQRRFRAS
jgi:hypothetical protein